MSGHSNGERRAAQLCRCLLDVAGELGWLTDRATDAVRDVLWRATPVYAGSATSLLTVAFDEAQHWRPNPFMQLAARELGLELI